MDAARRAAFAAVTDHARDYVLVLDRDAKIVFASRAVETILGVRPDELIGVSSFANKDPAERERLAAILERLLANPGVAISAEYSARHADGHLVPLHGTARNMLDDPAVRGIVINAYDVSPDRRSAEELRKAERQYREILDSVPVMVYSVEAQSPFRPVYVSRGHEMLGYSRDEWMNYGLWEDLLHWEDRDRVLAAAAAARESRTQLDIEYRALDKDGRLRWLVDHGRFTYDSDGEAEFWQGVMIDVTERHDAERALRASEERYRALFNEDVAANFVSSPDGRLLACNEYFARLFGFATVEQALATPLSSVYERPQTRAEYLQALRDKGKVTLYDLRARRVDGTSIRLVSNARAYFDERGEINEIHGHVIDVTERRVLEDQLRQAQRMESLGRLAGGIAHDFNNLLGIVGNYAGLVRENLAPDSQEAADLGEILRAVERGSSLTTQLLTFSRKRPPETTPVDVDAAIGDAERMLGRLLGPEVQLSLDLHGEGARVMMDRGHMDQILVNLLLNAVDAMPAGGPVVVSTRLVREGPESVRIEVRDRGIGMDAETVRKAVDPFFTTKQLGRGTGLGLSSVYGIVKQLGGDLSLQSAPGEGTSVVMHLPVTRVAAAPGPTPGAPPPAGSAPARAVRVLVVEDEEGVRNSLGRLLRKFGHSAVLTRNGVDALRAWDEGGGAFDLVLTDLRMPDMGGEQLIRELRTRGVDVPVLAMSGYPEDQSRLPEMLEARVAFIAKPYSVAAMIARVEELARSR